MTFDTVSDLVKAFGKYSCLNFNTEEDGVVTVYKAFKDGLWHYFQDTAPDGIVGRREYHLIMTSGVEIQ